ncbi:hypothetical protein HMI54_003359 [Coelomomyces lativittatus]|nr:hypothetical protein HMI54_003359 [Coelomomyces lativittatus]
MPILELLLVLLKNGLDVNWCKQPDIGLPQPDLVLYLDLSNEERKKRKGYGEERYENDDFQDKVRHIFLNHLVDSSYWKIIPANQSIDSIHLELLNHVMKMIAFVKNSPILELWKI